MHDSTVGYYAYKNQSKKNQNTPVSQQNWFLKALRLVL